MSWFGSSSREEGGGARFLQQIRQCVELRLKVIGALDPVLAPVPLSNTIIHWDEIVGKEVPDTALEPREDAVPDQRAIG